MWRVALDCQFGEGPGEAAEPEMYDRIIPEDPVASARDLGTPS